MFVSFICVYQTKTLVVHKKTSRSSLLRLRGPMGLSESPVGLSERPMGLSGFRKVPWDFRKVPLDFTKVQWKVPWDFKSPTPACFSLNQSPIKSNGTFQKSHWTFRKSNGAFRKPESPMGLSESPMGLSESPKVPWDFSTSYTTSQRRIPHLDCSFLIMF